MCFQFQPVAWFLDQEYGSLGLRGYPGDGGDEVFAGYNRYLWAARLWSIFGRLPHGGRKALGALARLMPPDTMNRLGNAVPGQVLPRQLGDKLHKLAGMLNASDIDAVYRQLISQWPDPGAIVIGGDEPHGILWDETVRRDRPDTMGRMQLLDMATYLPVRPPVLPAGGGDR